jgi:hypothetical protein
MKVQRVVWDQGMPQESVQYIDTATGKTVQPPQRPRIEGFNGQTWDRGMPQETFERWDDK